MVDRCVVIGQHGELELVPRAAKLGDRICILHGPQVSMLLKPFNKSKLKMLGECYFEGAMHSTQSFENTTMLIEFVLAKQRSQL
jgi:hypothetical protein